MPKAVEQKKIKITKASLQKRESDAKTVEEFAVMAEHLGIPLPATMRSVWEFINQSENARELILINRLSRRKLKGMGITIRRKKIPGHENKNGRSH